MNSIFKRLIVCGLLLGVALGLQVSAQQTGAAGQKTPQQAGNDALQLSLKGRKLSAPEAAALEQRLAANPNDLETRFILIGYYTTSREPAFKRKRAEQAFWVIENIPDSPQVDHLFGVVLNQHDEGFDKARKLWLKQLELHPGNTAVLSNAVDFFLLPDRALAEKLLKAGAAAEPNEARWPSRLGRLYMLELTRFSYQPRSVPLSRPRQPDMVVNEPDRVQAAADFRNGTVHSSEVSPQAQLDREAVQARLGNLPPTRTGEVTGRSRRELATLAFEQFALAHKLTLDEQEKRVLMIDLAKSAFESGNLEQARGWATALVNDSVKDWNYGNEIHYGHLILGRLALLSGDLEGAKDELFAAGKTPGSPQLNSFGPNMVLAKELLEKGERKSVLRYFELCASFWQFQSRLPEWTETVKSGGIPNFGANLSY